MKITAKQLANVLADCLIIDRAAIDDAEGYDALETQNRIAEAARRLSEDKDENAAG